MSHPSVVLYALSTCIHCRHTKKFLEDNNIPFDCTYVDQLQGAERDSAMERVREVNPRMSFPTLIVGPGHTVVVGFNPDAIKEALTA